MQRLNGIRIFRLWTGILVLLLLMASGCGQKSKNTEERKSLDDLKNAIYVIEKRRESEHKIIDQEEYMISVLKDNLEKANSKGMKDKIRDEIVVKRAVITKAKKNIANQNLILTELNQKRDSIENSNKLRIE